MTDRSAASPPRVLWLWASPSEEALIELIGSDTWRGVAPSRLPISPELVERIRVWVEEFDAQGPLWEWEDRDAKVTHRAEGFALAADLQRELAAEADIYYADWFQRHSFSEARAGRRWVRDLEADE
jgi:hypothetical protein